MNLISRLRNAIEKITEKIKSKSAFFNFILSIWFYELDSYSFWLALNHRAYQAKFAFGCFDFRLKPIYTTALAASKNDVYLKVVKIDSKIIISLI